MPTVTIKATFKSAGAGNFATVKIQRTDPPTYEKTIFLKATPATPFIYTDVRSGLLYDVILAGHTPGEFDLSITGDIETAVNPNPYTGVFQDLLSFTVK